MKLACCIALGFVIPLRVHGENHRFDDAPENWLPERALLRDERALEDTRRFHEVIAADVFAIRHASIPAVVERIPPGKEFPVRGFFRLVPYSEKPSSYVTIKIVVLRPDGRRIVADECTCRPRESNLFENVFRLEGELKAPRRAGLYYFELWRFSHRLFRHPIEVSAK